MTTIGPPTVNEVLLRIALYLVTLSFFPMEGQIIYVEFIRSIPPYFDGDPRFNDHIFFLGCLFKRDPRFDAYIFLLSFHEILHKFGLLSLV